MSESIQNSPQSLSLPKTKECFPFSHWVVKTLSGRWARRIYLASLFFLVIVSTVMAIQLFMGLLGLPLAYGLLRKKMFALVMVYTMFGSVLLFAVVRLPVVIKHYDHIDQKVSGAFDAGLLLVWLLSVVYYRRRRARFH